MGITSTEQIGYIGDADIEEKPLGLKKKDKDAFIKARDALDAPDFQDVKGWGKMDDLVAELGGLDAKAVKKQKVSSTCKAGTGHRVGWPCVAVLMHLIH
jgi:hypothetical protein